MAQYSLWQELMEIAEADLTAQVKVIEEKLQGKRSRTIKVAPLQKQHSETLHGLPMIQRRILDLPGIKHNKWYEFIHMRNYLLI